jgi:hypothetical protein
VSKIIHPMEKLKQLLAKCETQMAEIEKARARIGARKIQKVPPIKLIRKS